MAEQTLFRSDVTNWESSRRYGVLKRLFDIAVSLVALILLAPFLGLIAIAIKRDSPGPVIYRGARMGQGGRVFKILKFRTMYETQASYSGPRVTAQDDPRVTPLGHWLRNTKLNELPQFWNVLVGDMSLVGPRPEDPEFAGKWPKADQEKIFAIRPGITSPASVLYRNEEAMLCVADVFRQYVQDVGPDKLRLDELYVRYRSFCLDLDTLLWTVLIFVPRFGTQNPPERLLFVGPVTRLVRRYVSWFMVDLLVTLLTVASTGLIWRAFGPLNVGWAKSVVAALALALLFSVTGAAFGVNRITWAKAAPADALDILLAWAVATAAAVVATLVMGVLPWGLVVVAALLSLLGFVAVRYRSRMVTGLASYIMRHRARAQNNRKAVLIVGSGANAQHAAWILQQPANAQEFQVTGFVDDDLFAQGMRMYGAPVVGTWGDLPDLIAKHNIRLVILADHSIALHRSNAIAEIRHTTNATFMLMPNLIDSLDSLCKTPAACQVGDGAQTNCIQCLTKRDTPRIDPSLRIGV